MAIIIGKRTNLDAPIKVESLNGVTFTSESEAHQFVVRCEQRGQELTLAGTISAKFIRADGNTIQLVGSIVDGAAVVTLAQDCYNVQGRFQLAIFNTVGNAKLCIYACVGTVQKAQSGNLIDGGSIIPDVEDLIADIQTAVQSIPPTYDTLLASIAGTYDSTKTYAVGDYVWYDGQLKRCIVPITTAEAWTAAHWVNAVIGDDVNGLKSAISQNTQNLFDLFAMPEKTGISVTDNVITGTAGAFNTAYGANTVGIMPDAEFDANTRYTVSFDALNENGGTGNGLAFIISYTDATVGYIVCNLNESVFTHHRGITAENKTVSKIGIGYFAEPGKIWQIKNIQVESGTTETQYTPHLSAVDVIARQSIENIESVDSKIVSQLNTMNSYDTFRDVTKPQTTVSGITCSCSNGIITLDGSNSADVYFDLGGLADIPVVAGEEYWLSYGSPSATTSYLAIYFDTGSGLTLGYNNLFGQNKIVIPNGTTNMLVRLYAKKDVVFNNTSYKLTISKAKSNADFEKGAEIRFLGCFGTGDCTIVKFSDGTVLVIDFGLNEAQETLYRNWGRAIDELKITHIDYAIISHYHSDHVGMLLRGIDSLIDSNTTVFLPQPWTAEDIEGIQWTDTMTGDGVYNNYVAVGDVLENNGCRVVYPAEDEKWVIGGAEIQFWNVDHQSYLDQYNAHTMYDYNPCSLCNYLTLGDERICFTGDSSEEVFEKYKTSALPSQIFKVNHHSIGYNMVPLFMNRIMPEVSISMLGESTARARFATNPNQLWHEENRVPHINTGINGNKNLSLRVSEHGYIWNTSCKRCIIADEGLT